MKRIILILSALTMWLCASNAEVKPLGVAVAYPHQTVEFFPQPQQVSGPAIPLLLVKTTGGDSFGIRFQSVDGNASFIDLLDASGKVVRTISVNDILGKASDGVKLVSSVIAGSSNRSENTYDVTMPQGKATLVISSLATAGVSTKDAPAKLIVKIALMNAPASVVSAKITLPFDGSAEAKTNGFVLAGHTSTQAITATVFPQPEKVAIAGKTVTITTKPAKMKNEIVVGMLTIDAANTKNEAAAQLLTAEKSTANDITIVTTADKASAQPADTVTYRIVCSNIGKGSVSDIVITNPVSAGTHYLEGSAAGDETQITLDRAAAAAPQLGAVRSIKWKLVNKLSPGDEKVVSFKVIVE
jgi:uncharacterized repeat protein (TIGR01451 family)